MHVHDIQPLKSGQFNLSHTINLISFGQHYPGLINPLDGQVIVSNDEYSSMYQYFVKIVPTTYEAEDGSILKTNQFSVTQHYQSIKSEHSHEGGHGLPGVFFIYDLSPIMVHVTEQSKSFLHFLTSLCSIIGGIFTVAGILDSLLYQGMKTISRKNKQTHPGT